ncbi:hypothetical protein [Roseateles sp.]|uniref:hypothetical protein n=1 Tax=Roseateles sp. TaxID=1971397 RepID=UPI003D0BDB4E
MHPDLPVVPTAKNTSPPTTGRDAADPLLPRRRWIASSFLSLFEAGGFAVSRPIDVLSTQDGSVLFTSATINVFRALLVEPGHRRVVRQPCLRTHNLPQLGEASFRPRFMSGFHMLGLIDTSEDTAPTQRLAARCLRDTLGLASRLCVHVRREDLALHRPFLDALGDVAVRIDVPDKQYDWTYGEPGLSGRGLPLSLTGEDGTTREFGQIVTLLRGGRPIGVEFGFGEETFLAILDGLPSPFEASALWPVVQAAGGLEAPEAYHYVDLLYLFAQTQVCGISPGRGRHRSIARSAGRRLAATVRRLGLDATRVEADLNGAARLIEAVNPAAVLDAWRVLRAKYDADVALWDAFERNQRHLAAQGALSADRLEDRLRDYQRRLNLHQLPHAGRTSPAQRS